MSAPDLDFTNYLAELRERTPLVSLIGRRVTLKRSGKNWRGRCPFHNGKSDSFSVSHQGYRCFNAGCGQHGDAISFTRWSDGTSFRGAVERLAAEVGMPRPAWSTSADPEQAERDRIEAQARADRMARIVAQREAKEAAEDASNLAVSQALWASGVPIDGTLAERYLVEVRGLTRPALGWYSSTRYLPSKRELLLAITTENGEFRSVQRTLLRPDGRNLKRGGGSSIRLMMPGATHRGCVRLEPSIDSPVLIHGEGFETTSTPCTIKGYEGRAWLGGLANARPEYGRINVMLVDDDAPEKMKLLNEAIERWRLEGFAIVLAFPTEVRRHNGHDWNDLSRGEGAGAVEARLADLIARIEPPATRPSMPMVMVREATRAAFEAWCAGEGPAHLLLKGAPSVGKSQLAATFVVARNRARAEFIRDYRLSKWSSLHQAGQAADAAGFPRQRLRYFGENHEAVAQTLAVARSHGLSTVHDGGYDRPYDPSKVDGPAVCSQPKRRILTQAAGVSMVKGACGDPSGDGPLCFDRLSCQRWGRLAQAAAADVVGMVLERAFDHYLPRELAQGFDFTIIDEGLDRVAYAETEMDPSCLSDELFNRNPVRGTAGEPDAKGEPDDALTAEARAAYTRLRSAFADSTGTYVAAPMDEPALLRLIALTEARDKPDTLSPATSMAERERIAATSFRSKIRAICGLLRAMLAGPGRVSSNDDGTGLVAVIRPRRTLHPSIVDGRALLVDGTGEIASVRRFLPDAELIEPPLPTAPHQFAVHILTSTGKFAMRSPGRRDYLRSLVRLYGDDRPGISTHFEHEEAFQGLNAILGHPGKLTSRNDWKDCSTFFNFGVPSLNPTAAATGGAGRTGEAVPVEMPVRTWQGIAMAGGGTEWIQSQTYVHPAAREAAEAVRERQAIQGAGGRPRGPNRGPDNPVTVFHVGRVAVPHMEINVLIRGPGQHAPERFVRAMARGFMVDSAPDRKRMHPSIYKEVWTGQDDRKSEVGGFIATARRVLFPAWQRQGPNLPMCAGRYWVAGRGHRREGRAFVCRVTMLDDVKALLRERCKATDFEVTDPCMMPDTELARTQLNPLLFNPRLATSKPAEPSEPAAPVWMVAQLGNRLQPVRAPPDG
jgi:hypothetical protein